LIIGATAIDGAPLVPTLPASRCWWQAALWTPYRAGGAETPLAVGALAEDEVRARGARRRKGVLKGFLDRFGASVATSFAR
jgi:hypothetical protein